MSHAKDWRCANDACKAVLGQWRAHVLIVFAPRPAVGGGKVAVSCSECGSVSTWQIEEPVRAGGR